MYLRILKKDLKRKKTMNFILLIFIILAATFIASSANNTVSVMNALDTFFDKAEVPDYWFFLADKGEMERFEKFADDGGVDYRKQTFLQIDPKEVEVEGEQFDYTNTVCLSPLKGGTKIFDKNDKELTRIEEGEIYLTGLVWNSVDNDLKIGDTIEITANGKTKEFTLAGSTKDALFGSAMAGMTRFVINDKDYEYFVTEDARAVYSLCVYTDEKDFMDGFNELSLNTLFNINRSGAKNTYIMDMVMAAVMLIVSVCLILISMVILRFTIHFTMSEEFREIGVMKAIGIRNNRIRMLYITKYFTISFVGGVIGLILSVPFGNMMLGNLSQNMVMSGDRYLYLSVICAMAVVAIVVLFCYFCTRRIKHFSPVDAIRNGENGERYSRKGVLSLSRSRVRTVPFLAVNDILSGVRRYVAMLVIFTLGILLVIVPVNTINTVQSDELIIWFNMAKCHQVVSEEQLFNVSSNNREIVEEYLKDIKKKLSEKGIEADVFEEVMFRMNISHHGKRMSSLAFQGVGDITTDMYAYIEGTAPKYTDEVAISHIVAKNIGAGIGDTVEIKNGEETKEYIVTAIYQSMNNMGEGIRFHQDEKLDYRYASGSFGAQILYPDDPDASELEERLTILKEMYPNCDVYAAGDYINHMIGDVAEQVQGIKWMILLVVLSINILVTVLMVKSFITKEKGEIAMLKAIGFRNSSLISWQTLRIGIVLFLAVVIGTALSTPISEVSSGQIFKIMGAYSIEFTIVPLEVYVIYPLIVLGVTVLFGMLAAMQVRKITASDTSNIE